MKLDKQPQSCRFILGTLVSSNYSKIYQIFRIDTGVVPDALKVSTIRPIHKGGDGDDVSNYRPISLLPALSKILEKLVNKRLKNFLESRNILSNNQFGFRMKRSTEDAVTQLTSFVTSKLDRGERCLGVFLDFAKAFDTVSIPILLAKLESIGIRGLPLLWFQSYLSNRKQKVKIGNDEGDYAVVNFGVPQGSILGPTLFLVYINELCKMTITNGQVITFADDTVLLFHGPSWADVQQHSNEGLRKVSAWLQDNLLTANTTKTKYITFAITARSLPSSNLDLVLHGCSNTLSCSCPVLERKSSIKYLGVIIDEKLNWSEHIRILCGRTRKLIRIFKKLRHVADRDVLMMVYYALAQSILGYCITAWGAAAQTHMLPLERAQRLLLKVMFFKPRRYATTQLYNDCSVLSVRQLYIKHLIIKQHCTINLDEIKVKMNTQRRTDRIFIMPSTHTVFAQKKHSFLGPFIYNQLSKTLNLLNLTRTHCAKQIHNFLSEKNYLETEEFLKTSY